MGNSMGGFSGESWRILALVLSGYLQTYCHVRTSQTKEKMQYIDITHVFTVFCCLVVTHSFSEVSAYSLRSCIREQNLG